LGSSKGPESSVAGVGAGSSRFRYVSTTARAIFLCFLLFSQEANSLASPTPTPTPSNNQSNGSASGVKRIAIL